MLKPCSVNEYFQNGLKNPAISSMGHSLKSTGIKLLHKKLLHKFPYVRLSKIYRVYVAICKNLINLGS